MWITMGTAGMLVALSIWDGRYKKVPLGLVALSGLLAAAIGIVGFVKGDHGMGQLCLSLIPGAALLLAAIATGKAGIADGLIIMALGMVVGYREILMLLTFSLLVMSLCSVLLLALRRANWHTQLPYLPFLCIVYLIYEGVVYWNRGC